MGLLIRPLWTLVLALIAGIVARIMSAALVLTFLPLLAFLRFRVNLLKLSIVNLHPESLLYGWQVHVQSVTCELYAVTQAAR